MVKFRLWLARTLLGKHGAIVNMTFGRALEIVHTPDCRVVFHGNTIKDVR